MSLEVEKETNRNNRTNQNCKTCTIFVSIQYVFWLSYVIYYIKPPLLGLKNDH